MKNYVGWALTLAKRQVSVIEKGVVHDGEDVVSKCDLFSTQRP